MALTLQKNQHRIENDPDFDHRALETLIKEVQEAHVELQPLEHLEGEDELTKLTTIEWNKHLAEERAHMSASDTPFTWHHTSWLVTEAYFYRRLLYHTRYALNRVDPFAPHKDESLASALPFIESSLAPLVACFREAPADDEVPAFFRLALFGNRADLSLTAGRSGSETAGGNTAVVLADHSARVVQHLCSCRALRRDSAATGEHNAGAALSSSSGHVIVVLDNYGLELVSDLVLADALISAQLASRVTLHCKQDPTFVSDAIVADIERTLTTLGAASAACAALAARLRHLLDQGALLVDFDRFYNSGHPAWDTPPRLLRQYAAADLVIVKGDANYRRLLGDRVTPVSFPFQEAMGYWPADVHLIALRTCKAPLAVGIDEEALRLAENSGCEDWRNEGKCGVLQYNHY